MDEWEAGEVKENKMIFIGKKLDADQLRASLWSAFYEWQSHVVIVVTVRGCMRLRRNSNIPAHCLLCFIISDQIKPEIFWLNALRTIFLSQIHHPSTPSSARVL